MKKEFFALLSLLSLMILFLTIFGCATKESENVVDNLSEATETRGAITVIDEEVESTPSEEKEKTNSDEKDESYEELIKRLSIEKGLIPADNTTSGEKKTDSSESVSGEIKEIIIENFIGKPSNFSIYNGTTVRFVNKQPYQHIIGIRPKEPDNTWGKNINELGVIFKDETYEFTFTQTGIYQWYSKSKYPTTSGIITVK